MRNLFGGALVAFALLVVPRVGLATRPVPCPDLLFPAGQCTQDAGAAVAQCCPCDGFRNHGQHVRCVAHAVNALRKAECLDKEALRSMKRCAARSTCGKPEGFVTCCRQIAGECDDDGFCAKSDPPVLCTTDTECPTIPKCSTKSNSELCDAIGGVSGTGSCCDACIPVAP